MVIGVGDKNVSTGETYSARFRELGFKRWAISKTG
jgi:hypothetical protein